MRYANPFRFYLSASIIFFLIYSFTASTNLINTTGEFNQIETAINDFPEDSIQKYNEKINDIPEIKNNNIRLDSLLLEQKGKKTVKDIYVSEESLDSLNFLMAEHKKFNIFSKFYKETAIVNSSTAMDSLNYSPTSFNQWIYKKAIDWNIVKTNPNIFLNYFIGKLPLIIFFYLPIFAVFIWLLYIRRPFNYMEHLIFTFHVQTVFFVIFGLAYLTDYVTNSNYGFTAAILIFLFYLYKAMRNFYAQNRVKTVLKYVLLNIIFFTLAIVATIVSLFASFAIF